MTDLAQLAHILRRNLLRTFVLGLIGATIGLALVNTRPDAYQSTAVVLAAGTPGALLPDIAPEIAGERRAKPKKPRLRTPDTEAQLIKSSDVLNPVSRKLDIAPEDLAQRIRISAPPNTRVLNITFTAGTAELAQKGATEVGLQFVGVRKKLIADRSERMIAKLLQRRESLRELAKKTAIPALRGTLNAQVDGIDRGAAEVTSMGGARTEIVRTAQLPTAPLHRNTEVPPVSGLLGGCIVGFLWSYLRDRRWPKVRDADQVRTDVGLAVFAELGTREQMRGLATEVRLAKAGRVLVTGVAAAPLIKAVGKLLGNALGHVDQSGEVLVSASRPSSAYTLSQAQKADLVLLVAEVDRSRMSDLEAAARVISRTHRPAAVILTPSLRGRGRR